MLASLMASGAGHISTAVALEDDPEPVVGSFTVGGLTYAIVSEGEVVLVSVGPDADALAVGSTGAGEGLLANSSGAPSGEDSGSGVPPRSVAEQVPSGAASLSPSPEGVPSDGAEGEDADDPVVLEVPESVEFDGVAYSVVAIGPRALAGCDADAVAIPATVESIDELAFRGSAVAAIEVADGNSHLSSYDGMLFDAERISLLLIPEGKQGAARIPSTAEAVPPGAFSHCASVTSLSVDAGSAAYLSRNGCLYDASGEALLRVPAGATEIVIADGCTAVAAGALEGCAELRAIQASASVTEVSPDVLGAAVAADGGSAPVASLGSSGALAADGGSQMGDVGDADAAEGGSADGPQAPFGDEGRGLDAEAEAPAGSSPAVSSQLTSLVVLATAGDDLPQVNSTSIIVSLPEGADPAPWEAVGFEVEVIAADADGNAETVEGESLDDITPEDAHDHDVDEPDDAPSDGPVIVDEVTIDYGYANERSSADGAYERAVPKIDAVLKLQPITAEELMEGEVAARGEDTSAGFGSAADGSADGACGAVDSDAGSGGGAAADAADADEGEPTLASKLADLPEDSQATASFLYEGCLYVIDPEGGAALVAVDPKRLAECVEDPTTLILPDYVDDGTWSYPLTRIAKGALRGSGIERLWIPASATYLDYALEGCETLRYVEISEDSPAYSSKGGCLYDKAGEKLWMVPEGGGDIAIEVAVDGGAGEINPARQTDQAKLTNIAQMHYPASLSNLSTARAPRTSYRTTHLYTTNFHSVTDYTTQVDVDGTCVSGCETDDFPWTLIWTLRRQITNDRGIYFYTDGTISEMDPYGQLDYQYVNTISSSRIYRTHLAAWSSSPLGPPLTHSLHTGPIYLHCGVGYLKQTVTWADTATGSTQTETVPLNGATTAPSPSRTGYTFAGWYTAASGGSYVCGAGGSVTVTSDVTYYAHWTPNTYTVSYHNRAGTYLGGGAVSYDQWFNLWGNPGGTPGYTPVGWAWAPWQSTAAYGLGAGASNLATGGTVNLYLAEVPNTYTVTYHARSGTRLGSDTFTYDSAKALWGNPGATTGYTAHGWATSPWQGSASLGFGQAVTQLAQSGNVDLFLAETPNSYLVTLDAAFPAFANGDVYEGYGPNGVSKDAGAASVTATFDAGMPSATMPRATGYRFEGYFDDAGTCYYNADGSSARTWNKPGSATLHARWSVERHELTLDVGNGEVPSAASRGWARDPGDSGLYRLSYSIEWVEESGGSLRITLPAPATKPGYATFDGWTGGGIAKPSKSVIVQPWELADRAYTGAFSGAAIYSASLDLAGGRFDPAPDGWAGSGGSWSRSFTVESEAFSLPAPARDGYSFEGWAAISADGSLGAPAKDVTVPKGSWGDRSWRAAWKAVEYRISYDLAGGTMSGERTSYTIEDAGFELPVPARDGYSFQGWEVTGANGAGLSQQGVATTVKQGTWGDLHATAKWATASYVATLDLAGGSFASAPEGWSEAGGSWTRSFTVESDAFQLPTPARTGHGFLGWALVAPDGSLGSPAVSVTVPKGTVGDRSYRAVWQARSYSITWHYSGQSIDGQQSATSSQAYGQAIAFPSRPSEADPAREHYDFEGWFTEREGGERVQAGDYLVESDSTWYARWRPVEYTVHLHLGDDDAYAQHPARIEQGGQALPLAPDGHFDVAYTVEDEVRLPMVTDDPTVPKPVREGMSFVGWVECAEDGSFDPDLVPSMEVVLPVGSHGDRHYRAVWSFALRFEVPSAVSFRFDLADVAVDVAGADPDAIVSDRSKVQLRVMDASLPDPWTGWVPLPTTSAPERVDPYDLGALGFGDGNALAPLASKPLRYDIEVQDPVTTLAGEVDAPLAKIVFTVKGLW